MELELNSRVQPCHTERSEGPRNRSLDYSPYRVCRLSLCEIFPAGHRHHACGASGLPACWIEEIRRDAWSPHRLEVCATLVGRHWNGSFFV